jgi:hypothetical protein
MWACRKGATVRTVKRLRRHPEEEARDDPRAAPGDEVDLLGLRRQLG